MPDGATAGGERGRERRLDVGQHLRFLAEEVRNTELRRAATGSRSLAVAVWRQGDVDFHVPPMDFHLLLLCLGGRHEGENDAAVLGGRTSVVYTRDALFFVPAGNPVRARFTGAATHLHLMIDPAVTAQVAADLGARDPLALALRGFNIRRDARLRGLALAARGTMNQPGQAAGMVADGVALAASALLVESQGPGALRPGRAVARGAPLPPAALARAVARIEEGLGEPLSIAALAQDCGLGVYAFARAFRAATGQPPHQFLIARRVERARTLLLDSDASIAEIAYACGFASQAHMTATFTARLGVSPGRLRAQRR